MTVCLLTVSLLAAPKCNTPGFDNPRSISACVPEAALSTSYQQPILFEKTETPLLPFALRPQAFFLPSSGLLPFFFGDHFWVASDMMGLAVAKLPSSASIDVFPFPR